jgi:hypothetical protein
MALGHLSSKVGAMTFQFWFHILLGDAAAHNRAHIVARLGQPALRQLHDKGAEPSIEAILRHGKEKPTSKISIKGIRHNGQGNKGMLARAS